MLDIQRANKANVKRECKEISLQLFEAQKNLRILSNVAWSPNVEKLFHAGKPIKREVHRAYRERPLAFRAVEKSSQLREIEKKIARTLEGSSLASIMSGRARDYATVAQLLAARGTPEFGGLSRQLWGSTRDELFSDGTTVYQYAKTLRRLIKALVTPEQRRDDGRVIPAPAAAELMKVHFRQAHLLEYIDVVLSDKITANAAACVGKIKLRSDAMYSVKDIDVLIYHEAYTHVATATNGRAQLYAKFLGFDSPRCTSTQEGLAVLMEIFSNTTYPQRILKIADRVIATGMAEEGADLKEVHDDLCQHGYSEREAYQIAARVFRGTNLDGGQAFTKDVAYLKGLIECFNFIQYCLVKNKAKFLPYLFAGKLNVNEVPGIFAAAEAGLVQRPKWIPGQFQDLGALSSWFICTAALGQMGDTSYHDRFEKLFSH